jgi:hypothetical protein
VKVSSISSTPRHVHMPQAALDSGAAQAELTAGLDQLSIQSRLQEYKQNTAREGDMSNAEAREVEDFLEEQTEQSDEAWAVRSSAIASSACHSCYVVALPPLDMLLCTFVGNSAAADTHSVAPVMCRTSKRSQRTRQVKFCDTALSLGHSHCLGA